MSARYQLIVQPSVHGDVRSVPQADLRRILHRIESLAQNPRPPGSKKLADPAIYRVRQGDYRIVYEINR